MSDDLVLRERRGAALLLTLNRPEKLNALSTPLLDELDGALDDAEAYDDVRVTILTGAGAKAFVAGADIEEYSRLDQQGFVAYAFPTYEGSGIKRDVPEAERERIVALAKKVLATRAAEDDIVQVAFAHLRETHPDLADDYEREHILVMARRVVRKSQ